MRVEGKEEFIVTYYFTREEFRELKEMGIWEYISGRLEDNERIVIEQG